MKRNIDRRVRLLRILVVDKDVRLPVGDQLVLLSPEIFTDKTDEELLLDINIGEALKAHNAKRTAMLDPEETRKQGRDVLLEERRWDELTIGFIVVSCIV